MNNIKRKILLGKSVIRYADSGDWRNWLFQVWRERITVVYVIFLLFAVEIAHAQTDVYLKVYTKTFQRMEIDLYPFNSNSSGADSEILATMITEVLKNDLWMSGYFKINLKYGPPPEGPATNDGSGSLAWVNGTFTFNSKSLRIKPNVVDKASGRTIMRSDFNEPPGHDRRAVHRIADEIVYKLTGERGIAVSKIAYVHETGTGSKEIAIMDYDGKNSRTLTADRSINLSPAWSPNGDKICYTSFKGDNQTLYVLNLKTNTKMRLSALPGLNSAPAWSRDASRLAFTLSKDGNAEIYILDVEDKSLVRLTYNRAIDSSPTWASSNREIAFTSARSGTPQIYIMDTDGLNVRRLTFEGSYNDSPSWSPRGDKIVYVSRTDSGFDIYTIDVTGENRMRLTDSAGSNEDPCWSPNGFAIMFSSTRSGKNKLYSMFWDGTGQKELTGDGNNYLPSWSAR